MFESITELSLTATRCEENQEIGLVFDDMRHSNFDSQFVTFTGTMIAHDLIEHVNGLSSIGSVSDELEALGGVFYTRTLNGHNVTEDGLVGDLLGLVRESLHGLDGFIPPQPESDHDEQFMWIIEEFKSKVSNEIDEEDLEDFDLDGYCDQALQGLRLGVEKQEKRFATEWQALETFKGVQDAINKHFGVSDHYTFGGTNSFAPEFEGMQYILTITNDDDAGLVVSFDEHYEIDEDLCTMCGSALEDDMCIEESCEECADYEEDED